MTHGTPPSGGNSPDDNSETGALRRDDPPPGSYGQAQYGSPQGQQYGGATPPYGGPAEPGGRRLGAAALVLALAGAALAAVGLFAVRWTKVPATDGISEGPKFLDLRRVFVALNDVDVPDKPTFTITYFNWAAFVLIGAALLLAVLSALPTSATPAFRVLGFIVGLVSAAAAPLVPALDDGSDLSEYLKGGLGLWLVAGGSLLMAIGALIGSRRSI